jgi:hypothetical protein
VAPERIDIGASDAAFEAFGRAWGLTAPSRLLHRAKLALDAIDAKWNELVLGYGPDAQNSFMKWLGMNNPTWRKMMLTLIALVGGLVMLISVVLMLRYRPPLKDNAALLYQQFVKKTGLEPHTGETALVFAARIGKTGQTVDEITEAYLDARYGRNNAAAFERLRTAVRAMA